MLCAVVLALPVSAIAQTPAPAPAKETPPAKNFRLPAFTKEGFRAYLLNGSEARFTGDKAVDLTDVTLTVFAGDASNHVDTVILSPAATFLTEDNLARGASTVRLIRDDVEVTGSHWTYDHANKKVSIAKNVRVTFKAQLNDILK